MVSGQNRWSPPAQPGANEALCVCLYVCVCVCLCGGELIRDHEPRLLGNKVEPRRRQL